MTEMPIRNNLRQFDHDYRNRVIEAMARAIIETGYDPSSRARVILVDECTDAMASLIAELLATRSKLPSDIRASTEILAKRIRARAREHSTSEQSTIFEILFAEDIQ